MSSGTSTSTVRRPHGTAARFADRRRALRRRRWLKILIGSAVVLVVAGVVTAAYVTPVLGVRRIDVVGITSLPEQRVLEIVGVTQGDPMLRIDPGGVQRRVEEVPEVASAEVVRRWPTTLRIEVTEREAVALVEVEGAWRAVDRSGLDFTEVGQPLEGLPILDASLADAPVVVRRAALAVVVSLPDDVRAVTRTITAVSVDDVRFGLASGAEVRWGSPERSRAKAAALNALMARESALGNDVSVYDVSSPDVPTIR